MYYSKDKRGIYILRAMEDISLNGDAYTTIEALFRVCQHNDRRLSYSAFREDLAFLLHKGLLHLEGQRLYTTYNWRCEQSAVISLANILRAPSLDKPELPDTLLVNGVQLAGEQRSAVELALSSRLSLILGGAGSGKTTLVKAIMDHRPSKNGWVLCSPTGKAAQNLTDRTGFQARTVHSALGLRPDDDFLEPVQWPYVSLLVVDEASMMTLEMLAGILQRVPDTCHVVLVGDPYQLLSVGAGNILPDLLALGCPSITLKTTHRQSKDAAGLVHNTTQFSSLSRAADLVFDDSFQLVQLEEKDIQAAIRDEAVKRYLASESVQVLSPFNKATDLSVQSLNQVIQPLVNPPFEDKHSLKLEKGPAFWDSDRVMVTKNDRERRCYNGDVGILRIRSQPYETPDYSVALPDGRRPTWDDTSGLAHMCTAYAITVHKSQGSEYDTVLMPVSKQLQSMMVRNLLYTAITRAKKEVMLFGDPDTLDSAMQRIPYLRKSMLVQKTRMLLLRSAA